MEILNSDPLFFLIQTEITPNRFRDLLDFIYQTYILPLHFHFANVRRLIIDGKEVLTFTFLGPNNLWYVDVEITASNPIEVKMIPTNTTPYDFLSRLRENLMITIQMFEDEMRKTTLYFVWVLDQDNTAMKISAQKRKIIHQIFTGNMLLFFLIFLVFSYGIFFALTEIFKMPIQYFPLILVVVQLSMILFSHKILKQMGDWPITKQAPYVHILQCNFSPGEFDEILKRYPEKTMLDMKKKIYDKTLRLGRNLDVKAVTETFYEYGIDVNPESIKIKGINVYHVVEEAARRFQIPVPKIALSNIIIPNAAATGPSPRFGLILITTGLLIQLSKEEILSVISHELSHIKRRDPVALFALSSLEYLLRVYILWYYVYFFGLFYLFFALGIIYFIAKFFESRADLDSAIMTGRPQILADALIKIGHRRIRLERILPSRIGSWLGWNPHPPLSFRVERLEKIRNPNEIRHPFLKSIKDCINGL
ncbi:TPA: heat-shock protein HtpX, partial [Candidatus Bathyarchaeota archaeon]|nr:heat-shock protein HtpX [Candidatus Bathyarchaeota archaeon]